MQVPKIKLALSNPLVVFINGSTPNHTMPTYEKADKSVERLAAELIAKYESHAPLATLEVKIDYVFAHGDVNDEGVQLNDALKKNGIKALGIARVVSLKDRVLGRGDAEIALDGDWWQKASDDEQAALLDHELHHVSVKSDKAGNVQFDDIGRPLIKLRRHDIDVGWFRCIAERHGAASQERIQARHIFDKHGQALWPDIATAADKLLPVGSFAKSAATKER